jgi:uncharacterized phage infection (PIP) family protein YhgE
MNRKILILFVIVLVLLSAVAGWLAMNLQEEKQANREMQELAALDKQEMENQYEELGRQYSEMMTQINNDSIIEQLTQEQMRTQKLLEELKRVKTNDAREIARLKKELESLRAILRDYVMQIDSLNRENESLRSENTRINTELEASARRNESLVTEKASLSEKVAIAAQLDASNITMTPLNKRGKTERKISKAVNISVSFTVVKNVTATNGLRTFYVRITKPTGEAMNGGGTFAYENKQIAYSMKKSMEYTGEELTTTVYLQNSESLVPGKYVVSVFADGSMIGSKNFIFEK